MQSINNLTISFSCMHLNNACRTGLTAKTAAYTAHRINDCVTAMRNMYRLTGTCDKTGSTGNTLFFFYKSFFQNSSSFCLYSVYRRSCRFTVTLSQKQIVTLSSHTGLMQLSKTASNSLFKLRACTGQTATQRIQDIQRSVSVFSGCFIGIACTGHCAAHCPHCIHD